MKIAFFLKKFKTKYFLTIFKFSDFFLSNQTKIFIQAGVLQN